MGRLDIMGGGIKNWTYFYGEGSKIHLISWGRSFDDFSENPTPPFKKRPNDLTG